MDRPLAADLALGGDVGDGVELGLGAGLDARFEVAFLAGHFSLGHFLPILLLQAGLVDEDLVGQGEVAILHGLAIEALSAGDVEGVQFFLGRVGLGYPPIDAGGIGSIKLLLGDGGALRGARLA